MSVTHTIGSGSAVGAGPAASGVSAPDPGLERVVRNPTFQTLVAERTRFGWILTIAMLIVYFGFIGLIAFDKPLMAMKIAGTASLGLLLGVFVIVFAFVLTGIYVARANTRYDRLAGELARSLAR